MKRYTKLILLMIISGSAITGLSCRQSHKIKFTKILFHTMGRGCFGFCPSYHLELNGDKTIRLFAETVFKRKSFMHDSTKIGYFVGNVSETTFDTLSTIIDSIGLDSLKFEPADCCDGSTKTVIVYYNGKRKFLKSMFPPEKAGALIRTLYDICEKSDLRRVNYKFTIENESAEPLKTIHPDRQ